MGLMAGLIVAKHSLEWMAHVIGFLYIGLAATSALLMAYIRTCHGNHGLLHLGRWFWDWLPSACLCFGCRPTKPRFSLPSVKPSRLAGRMTGPPVVIPGRLSPTHTGARSFLEQVAVTPAPDAAAPGYSVAASVRRALAPSTV
jgi:hypothetical protein